MLAATGGSDRHALLVEHQMRPLFGFFQSLTLPIGIYARPGDFEDYELASPERRHRIDGRVLRTLPILASHLRLVAGDGARQAFTRPDVF